MKEYLTTSPPNSLILVMDYAAGELPERITDELVVATKSCLAIGTLSAADGETRITLTDRIDGIDIGDLAFDGVLATPNHELSVCNVKNERMITLLVPSERTRVKVFANDPVEPDDIVIFATKRDGGN